MVAKDTRWPPMRSIYAVPTGAIDVRPSDFVDDAAERATFKPCRAAFEPRKGEVVGTLQHADGNQSFDVASEMLGWDGRPP